MEFKFTIPIIGKIIAYIYDFCTYKRKWQVRIMFQNKYQLSSNKYSFDLKFINKTSYNIKIIKIFVSNGILYFPYTNNRMQTVYSKENYKTIELKPYDTDEQHFNLNGAYDFKNTDIIKDVNYQGLKTKIFIEYEIQDIKKSFFINNIRIESVFIPL
jgi:hypothetical protein